MASTDLRLTFGAMFIGCIISVYLCGIGILQTYRYFRHYRKKDSKIIISVFGAPFHFRRADECELTLLACRILDFIHTVLVCQGLWSYLILNWGNLDVLDQLNWSVAQWPSRKTHENVLTRVFSRTIAVSIVATGLVTYIVQLFFTYRVWRFSKRNIYLTVFIICMATARLASALATGIQMIRLGRFSAFINGFRWLFTFGLALSCVIEILLTSSLCYYLRVNRSGHSTMDEIIHKLLIYSISNGILTTFGSFLAMLFAVITSHNFLFIALHFIISKCYVNSLLATLNSRDALKKRHDSNTGVYQVSVEGHSQPRFRRYATTHAHNERPIPLSDAGERLGGCRSSAGELKVQVHVEQEVESDAGRESSPARSFKAPDLSPNEENVHTAVNLPHIS
ncbi:hypothetical protein ACEPAI_8357 [Sanghuangporus weigelae]